MNALRIRELSLFHPSDIQVVVRVSLAVESHYLVLGELTEREADSKYLDPVVDLWT